MTLDLYDTLQHVWGVLCDAYDVTSELPPVAALFEGADLSFPAEAAQIAMVNMLAEIMECVGRFSPWYKRPAAAFGILLKHSTLAGKPAWVLVPDAYQTYRPLLGNLAEAIEHNMGVILATRFVDDLEQQPEPGSPCRLAACQCVPPRTILVQDVVIARAEIICDACRQPFALAK